MVVVPVVSGNRSDTDLIAKMKFLILALCVCATSAASVFPYKKTYVYKPEARDAVVVPAVKSVTVQPFYKPEVSVPVVTPVPVVKSVPNVVDSQASILRYENSYDPESRNYHYGYETGNGVIVESSGSLKRVGDIDTFEVQGSYRYISPEGYPVEFTYVADENGYQPKSDLLPQSPPVPEAILRSLEYIASHPKYVEPVKKL